TAVEVVDGIAKCFERLAPEFVDSFFACAMKDHLAERQCFLKALLALEQQRIVALHLDAERLHLDDFGEDVGGTIEQRPREHPGLDPTPRRARLGLVSSARLLEARARDV